MGHRVNSIQAATVYQPPDRVVDLTGARHNLENRDVSIVAYHSSVSYASGQYNPTVQNQVVAERMNSPDMKPFVERFAEKYHLFTELSGGKSFIDFVKVDRIVLTCPYTRSDRNLHRIQQPSPKCVKKNSTKRSMCILT